MVAGSGSTGTLLNEGNTSPQVGKVDHGLFVNNGGQIKLTGDECFANIAACPDEALTLMMWIKTTGSGYPHLTYSRIKSINLRIEENNKLGMWIHWSSSAPSFYLRSSSTITFDTWTHVAAVYNHNLGGFIYLNGIMDKFKSMSNPVVENNSADSYPLFIGGKARHFPFTGVLDEIKLFYKQLSSSGKSLH